MYILISGGFDPLHSGHLNAIQTCANMGKVVVAPNSDNWLIKKKGSFLLPIEERANLLRHLTPVYSVLDDWDDSDGTACDAIRKFSAEFKSRNNVLVFANGGDRVPSQVNQMEFDLCTSLGILSIFGVGGGKTASSSNFINSYIETIAKS